MVMSTLMTNEKNGPTTWELKPTLKPGHPYIVMNIDTFSFCGSKRVHVHVILENYWGHMYMYNYIILSGRKTLFPTEVRSTCENVLQRKLP